MFTATIRHYYAIMILNSADILLTQKLETRLFSGFPAFLGHSNSIVSTIYCILFFLFELYFVFLFCSFHHFHEFFKNFADKMTTLYLNFTSLLLRRTSQKTAWFEIISSIGLIGLNGLIYQNQLICKLKNTIIP